MKLGADCSAIAPNLHPRVGGGEGLGRGHVIGGGDIIEGGEGNVVGGRGRGCVTEGGGDFVEGGDMTVGECKVVEVMELVELPQVLVEV